MDIDIDSDTEGSFDFDYANDDSDQIHVSEMEDEMEESDDDLRDLNADHSFHNAELPTLHLYLGKDLMKLNSPTDLLENVVYMNLPLLPRGQFVLFPGQILPLKVFQIDTNVARMVQMVTRTHHLFGVAYDFGNMTTGIIAEIFECDSESLKARGTKRFKVLREIEEDGYTSADVKILPDVNLDPALFAQRLTSLDHLRLATKTKEDLNKREKLDRLDAVMGLWPHWVYKQYDALRLTLQLRELLSSFYLKDCPPILRDPVVPTDPVELSFWVAQNILVERADKMNIFNSNCVIDRLRKDIEFLIPDHYFVCRNCGTFIADLSGLFPISKDGPQGIYVNGHANIYEVLTLLDVRGLKLSTMPASAACTWFPGYGWIIAKCEICGTQIGWKFVAMNKTFALETFWALACNSLRVTKISKNNGLMINKK